MGKRRHFIWWAGLIVALFFINFIASLLHVRFDLTEDKRYSVTPTTHAIVRQLNGVLNIRVFLKGDFPSEFRKLSTSANEFLSAFREAGGTKVRFQFVSPQEELPGGKTWADSLQAMGAAPINLNVQVKTGEENRIVFPYALFQYNGQSALVNLFQSSKRNISPAELNNAEAMMEYQFVKTIDRMIHPDKPFVGYAVGNGEPTDARTYDLQQTVGSNYKMFVFDLKGQVFIPDTIKALLIVKPTEAFSNEEKLKIDQYIMRGGKVLWLVDNLHAEQDSLSFKSELIAYERNLNIQDLLFSYGVRINPDLIMDLQCDFMPFAVGGSLSNPQYEFLHWNYYPLFESHNNHLINKNLGLVAGRFVNSVDTVESNGIRKTILLQSSSNARIMATPALISPNENRNAPQDVLFNKKDIPAAVLLEGMFTSFFRGRVSRVQRDSLASSGGYKEAVAEDNKMIVVADGDVVLNDVSAKQGPLPMGMNLYTAGSQYEYQFANRDFLLNCLEYLTSKSTIIETRNKEIVLRLLDAKKVDAEKSKWQLINIVLPILLIILFGFCYQQIRRSRFSV
jgi:gliding-associated putative ABC transporter substrate-binding component GldG